MCVFFSSLPLRLSPDLLSFPVCVQKKLSGLKLHFAATATMYQAVRKFVFTDCRCADDASKTYEELFAKLDTNKDGKVDVSELRAGLAAMGIKSGKGAAQVANQMH